MDMNRLRAKYAACGVGSLMDIFDPTSGDAELDKIQQKTAQDYTKNAWERTGASIKKAIGDYEQTAQEEGTSCPRSKR